MAQGPCAWLRLSRLTRLKPSVARGLEQHLAERGEGAWPVEDVGRLFPTPEAAVGALTGGTVMFDERIAPRAFAMAFSTVVAPLIEQAVARGQVYDIGAVPSYVTERASVQALGLRHPARCWLAVREHEEGLSLYGVRPLSDGALDACEIRALVQPDGGVALLYLEHGMVTPRGASGTEEGGSVCGTALLRPEQDRDLRRAEAVSCVLKPIAFALEALCSEACPRERVSWGWRVNAAALVRCSLDS